MATKIVIVIASDKKVSWRAGREAIDSKEPLFNITYVSAGITFNWERNTTFSVGQFMDKIYQCALVVAVRARALFIGGWRSPKSAKARLCASKAPYSK